MYFCTFLGARPQNVQDLVGFVYFPIISDVSTFSPFFLLISLSWHSAWASGLAKKAAMVSFSKGDLVCKTCI